MKGYEIPKPLKFIEIIKYCLLFSYLKCCEQIHIGLCFIFKFLPKMSVLGVEKWSLIMTNHVHPK